MEIMSVKTVKIEVPAEQIQVGDFVFVSDVGEWKRVVTKEVAQLLERLVIIAVKNGPTMLRFGLGSTESLTIKRSLRKITKH